MRLIFLPLRPVWKYFVNRCKEAAKCCCLGVAQSASFVAVPGWMRWLSSWPTQRHLVATFCWFWRLTRNFQTGLRGKKMSFFQKLCNIIDPKDFKYSFDTQTGATKPTAWVLCKLEVWNSPQNQHFHATQKRTKINKVLRRLITL